MSRKIKCKVWSKKRKIMKQVSKLVFWDDGTIRIPFYSDGFRDIPIQRGFVIIWFIGLKDKNGKEIYEGDIVRCNAIGVNFGTTIIKNDFFAEHIVELKKELQKDLEVIGNIYENPELMEVKK